MRSNLSASPRVRFEAIAEFAAVARRLSFAAAARDLGLDASVLSRRVAALEARLGVRLLQRTTRRVSLTEAGAEFFARAQDVLARMDDAEAAMSAHATSLQGPLRIGAPNLFGQRQLMPLLLDFMRLHPALRLDLTLGDRFDDLLEARLDCAIRIGALEHGGDLIVRRLSPNRRLLCASPAYLQQCGEPGAPAELAAHRLLHFRPLIGGARWTLHNGDKTEDVAVTPWLSADNAEALRLAAVDGQGIALLASFVAGDDLRAGRLVRVLPPWQPPESVVSVVYPHAPLLPLRVRVLIDFLAARFGDPPVWDRGL